MECKRITFLRDAFHFYDNQIDSAKGLINRDISALNKCTLNIKKVTEDFSQLEVSDFEVLNYNSLDKLNVKMIAPKNI